MAFDRPGPSPNGGIPVPATTTSPTTDDNRHRSTGNESAAFSGDTSMGPSSSGTLAAAAGAGAGGTTAVQHAPRVRRRNRMITSCLECRRRKLKCDKQHPCTNCVKTKRDCLFLAPALDSASQLKLTEIKEKMGSLERVLEQEVGRNGAWREARRERTLATAADDVEVPVPEDERDLEPTPMSVADAVYEKGDDDLEDDIADLGFAMGKMRLTDRIGGFIKPKFKEEIDIKIAEIPGALAMKKEILLPNPEAQMAAFGNLQNFAYLQPGPTYIPPSSSMYFSGGNMGQSLMDFLPAEKAADYLVEQYRQAVHPVAKIVHWASFRKRYDSFWAEIRSGIEPVGSLQALVFSVMFCGVVAMSEQDIMQHFAATKKELIDNFQQGAETALGRAQFLRTTKLETMQAFVMYMIPLCRDQLSRAHSALVGTAIRLAECMGLHRDGSGYGMNAVETHVRRMIWFQLCMLDIRTCEAHGPRPGIRENDFDTRYPLNLDDAELESASPPTRGADRWTDMTCTLIRMECNEMIRTIWTDRPRVEKKIISLTSLIARIQNFRLHIQEKYFRLMSTEVPLHKAARLMLIILTTRMHIMVLHRYQNTNSTTVPERLRQIIRSTGLESIEAAIEFETSPVLVNYQWLAGALQQYQVAFLLLAQSHVSPNSPEADRIWRVIDYVFEPPQHLTQKQKAIFILLEIRDRMDVYFTSRKLRAPAKMTKWLADEAESVVSSPSSSGQTNLDAVPPQSQKSRNMQLPTSLVAATVAQGPHYTGPAVSPLEDPDGSQHVQAILGAVGLGQNPLKPGTDWGATAFEGTPFNPSLSGVAMYGNMGQPLAHPGGSSMSAGAPRQDYVTAMANEVPSAPGINQGPPTTASDDVMAEIDWTEWDKLFPPDDSGISFGTAPPFYAP